MAPTLFQIASFLPLLASPLAQAAVTGHDHLRAHAVHAALHHKRQSAAVSTNIPSGWASQGCWTDDTAARTLSSIQQANASMTEEGCISWCSSNGYPYAGVEYANECFCGRALLSSATKAADSDCNMACAGSSSELCGGPNRLNVFKNTSYVAPTNGPATNAGPANWGFLGCYTDSTNDRTMSGYYPQRGDTMSVAQCTETCQTNGYLYAGVEYSAECFCSNTLDQTKLAPDGLKGCNMICNGNQTEFCGGANRLDVYGYGQKSTIAPKWANQGCYTDNVNSRTLRYQVGVAGGFNNMTVENCQAACATQKYNIAGVEYGQECWCDNSYQNNAGPASDGSAGCSMSCKGDSTETCGGPNRLNVYKFTGGSSTTTTAAPTATTGATTPTTTSAKPTITGIPKGWDYRGCYIDNAYGRILQNQEDSADTTIESCIDHCAGMNMTIAGLEYSTQCFCGTYMQNGGKLASQESDCAMPCGGNSDEVCGGPARMSIWSTSANFTTYQPPKALNSTLPGNWTYQGCLAEPAQNTKLMGYQIDQTTNMTIPYCLNLCAKYGYSAAGVEYGHQCFCGDDYDRVNAGVKYLDESQCFMECPGKPDVMCGGPNTLNYYTQPMQNIWGQGVGNGAGKYEFLIGGVVIPLITTVGTNNKVTFVEKHGTGPANSTGAFEFDPSEVGNFSAAWRTMNGLKTDVFCSAGLTLPDKVGRQINIGGWSADSLFGVRFYWPDGSPGVPSVNDWQENVDEVALQVGRWYPTAVQMANGSILVVGGEDGSNGKPVPNLEVLPKPAGGSVRYMDWLDRTDPNNLYPFLAVLPTGNIAVFYWNEARILDEKTFETVRTLPNIPGAVNNDKGGRTYPLEGTSMLMPQYAPYTDPLTVLICGGSTPYQGFALDNCVSIQPENPSANWTIERMPDRRVISCMTALPDGTYLILNGAHQGSAGFGLASDPNHMAVLYDPSKPLYHRMTRMANTTIDRLYHSEAILLPDGRVLVSGSDPEDNGLHEQEYRVEVFIPPYLMNNATRPAYTFPTNGTDWSYGQSYTIQLAPGSDCAKIALMGAVSSTHGNSMGQRSLFPAFSCSGLTCTVEAPPNAHVTGGPGWFMMFVLNAAGTPSISQWVRIGGDPAGLGNWPNHSDFTLPGS